MFVLRMVYNTPAALYFVLGYAVSSAMAREKAMRNRLLGRWLRKFLIFMGPLYVKMGQVLATRSDLLPHEAVEELRHLQDDCPPVKSETIVRILEREYKKPLSEVFAKFDTTPIATASIAQVHKAVLKTGEEVAVKIVKDKVRAQMARNLRTWRIATNILHAIVWPVRQFNLPQRVTETSQLLREQLSMANEIKNHAELYRNFKNHHYVKIPRVYLEHSTDTVLVMEFVHGVRGKDFGKLKRSRKDIARRLQETIYTMLYMDGVCHGDPHPGNVFFTEEHMILVDFGICAYLTETEKWGLASFYYAGSRHEWDLVVTRFTKYFTDDGARLAEIPEYLTDIRKVMMYHFDTVSHKWSTAAFFQDVNRVLRKYKARYATHFTKAELALMSCEGFATQIDPDMDIWENARRFSDHYSPFFNDEIKKKFDSHFAKTSPTSLALRDRGKKSLVASTHLDRYFFPSTYPLFVKEAQGSKITDVDNNVYVDLSCGYGPHLLGYGHPVLTKAISDASRMNNLNAVGHEAEIEHAELIVNALPGAEKVIFSNSGTESVIHAVRLCRAYRPKAKLMAKFEGHYHGFSDQAMVSSWFRVHGPKDAPLPIEGCRGAPEDIVKNTLVLQFGREAAFEQLRKNAKNVAGVIVEPLNPSSGALNIPYLKKLREVCTELDIPLVFDEVVSGFRVTYGGAQTIAGVQPDLTCLGKIIGGGLPCGAVAGKTKIIDLGKTTGDPFRDYEEKAFLGGTMSGNYISCSAGIAMLKYLKAHPELYDEVNANTEWMVGEMRKVAEKHGITARIKAHYSMFSVTFTHKESSCFREVLAGANFKATLAMAYWMRLHGVYMPELHGYLLSMAHTRDDFAFVVQAFDKVMGEMKEAGFFLL